MDGPLGGDYLPDALRTVTTHKHHLLSLITIVITHMGLCKPTHDVCIVELGE